MNNTQEKSEKGVEEKMRGCVRLVLAGSGSCPQWQVTDEITVQTPAWQCQCK